LDVTGEGSIDFSAFLVGLTFLSHNSSLEDAAKIVWATLDRDGTGSVPIKHVKKMLDMVFRRVDQRTIPLLREAKGKTNGTITYEEFVALLRLHPEYVPVALHVSALPVENRQQDRLSLDAAVSKLNEIEKEMKDAVDMTAIDTTLPERYVSFEPTKDLQENQEKALQQDV